MADYENISPFLAVIISRKMATLHELGTIYGLEDALDLYEIIITDAYNEYILSERVKNGTND